MDMTEESGVCIKSEIRGEELGAERLECESEEREPVPAVLFRNGSLWYGSGKNRIVAFDGLSLTVPAGVIYALLGPSGCGKTSLLNCILHMRTLRQGRVEVFGCQPGQQGTGVPGPWIGYMPQDLLLYPELSVMETLTYFGRLNCLSSGQLKERVLSLGDLLNLSDHRRQVSGLSGGQQRCLSLAVAMIHQPPLLILDEPTVAMDPILRTTLWNHLSRIVRSQGTTVLLTTHYVEEAREAHLVGMMRNGRILMEKNPDELMMEFGAKTMEEVFLSLCVKDNESNKRKEVEDVSCVFGHQNLAYAGNDDEVMSKKEVHIGTIHAGCSKKETTIPICDRTKSVTEKPTCSNTGQCLRFSSPPKSVQVTFRQRCTQVTTVVIKNFQRLKRNKYFLFAVVCIPITVQFLLRFLLGHDPTDLPLAVVNEEKPSILSLSLLKMIPEKVLVQKEFPSLQEGMESVDKGLSVGLLHIRPNFTLSIRNRLLEGINASETVVRNTQVHLKMGSGNYVHIVATYQALIKAFTSMANEMAFSLGVEPGAMQLPFRVENVPGMQDTPYSEVTCISWTCAVMYSIGLAASCLTFVQEMECGVLDRSIASGVTAGVLVTSELLMQMAVSLCHVSSALFFLWVSGLLARGSWLLASSVLFLLDGLGIVHGLLLSWLTRSSVTSLFILLALQATDFSISGMTWPVEAQANWARQVVFYLSPISAGSESLKMVLLRGLTVNHPYVWSSLLLNVSRIFLMLILLLYVIRIRK